MTREDFGVFCQRIGCEHTMAGHLNDVCDLCDCPYFLDPDYDDEPEQRVSRDAANRLGEALG